MSILIGLIPALVWGLLPVSVSKIGGKPVNQILGTAAGAFVVALAVFLYLRPELAARDMALSAASGALWILGQTGQYQAYRRIGVSKAVPISAGMQMVGTSLIGVLAFGEWPSATGKLMGFGALAVIILGIGLTSLRSKGDGTPLDKGTLLLLFLTNFGYLAYSSIPNVVSAKGAAIFLPQATGMLCAALAYAMFGGHRTAPMEAASWKNMFSGLLFSIGALAYIISAQRNGIATGFVLSQLNVLVSTICGIVILKEKKTPLELKATAAGLALILLGGTATALM